MFGPNWSEIADLEVWHVSLRDHLVEVRMKCVLRPMGLPAFPSLTEFSSRQEGGGDEQSFWFMT